MTKTIDTLIEDVKNVLRDGVESSDLDPTRLADLGVCVSQAVRTALDKEERKRKAILRMSNIGQPCNRKLYYEVNSPEDKEELPYNARLKFLFGHILEEILLYLAEVSGHKVEGRQDEVSIEGVLGHRDAVIDGVTIDVKSASTYSFKKFENHELTGNDPFGYISQIQSYLHAGQTDILVSDKNRAAFFVVDKTLGNLCLDIHPKQEFPIDRLYQYKKDMISRSDPPARGFEPVPDGKSGNMKLGLECSYCPFKQTCYPQMRTFIYSSGPRFMTTIKREPDVPEVLHKLSNVEKSV